MSLKSPALSLAAPGARGPWRHISPRLIAGALLLMLPWDELPPRGREGLSGGGPPRWRGRRLLQHPREVIASQVCVARVCYLKNFYY